MESNISLTNVPKCWETMVETVKYAVKTWVRETIEEVLDEKILNSNIEDKRLNTDELCERWHISKNTLYNWEKAGIIKALPIGGRRKVYSMKDVLFAESDGLVKIAC